MDFRVEARAVGYSAFGSSSLDSSFYDSGSERGILARDLGPQKWRKIVGPAERLSMEEEDFDDVESANKISISIDVDVVPSLNRGRPSSFPQALAVRFFLLAKTSMCFDLLLCGSTSSSPNVLSVFIFFIFVIASLLTFLKATLPSSPNLLTCLDRSFFVLRYPLAPLIGCR